MNAALVRNLTTMWANEKKWPYPLLKGFTIKAPENSGLRGLHDLDIELGFPVVFLSGANGSGKSTLLALSALAFHGVEGHVPVAARSTKTVGRKRMGYFTFKDFFHRGPGDQDVSGLEIEWRYSGGIKPVKLSKQSSKWMRYERRHKRPVEFIGLVRALPAIELPALRNHFKSSGVMPIAALSDDTRKKVASVLAQEQPQLEVLGRQEKYTIRRSKRAGGYTSFNMGSGEDAVITLLSLVDQAPPGSLIVIEELEAALHPAAQTRLVDALLEIAERKKLQIIGSTHSHHVLKALPPEARILIQRFGDKHVVVKEPSTELALWDLANEQFPELTILCEDHFAVTLVTAMLPKGLRQRVRVVPGGTQSKLAEQAEILMRVGGLKRCLILWDADVSEDAAKEYIQTALVGTGTKRSQVELQYGFLPGKNQSPEKWVLELVAKNALDQLADTLRFDSSDELGAILEQCRLGDHHSTVWKISEKAFLSVDAVETHLIQAAVSVAYEECESLSKRVLGCLNTTGDNPASGLRL
jgi:predicted ATPase